MPQQEPVTRTVKASEARTRWSQLINQVARRQTRVIVEKSGIPVAAIISTQDLERLSRLEDERQQDFAVLDEIGAAFQNETPEAIKRQVGQAVAEVRSENRNRTPRSP